MELLRMPLKENLPNEDNNESRRAANGGTCLDIRLVFQKIKLLLDNQEEARW